MKRCIDIVFGSIITLLVFPLLLFLFIIIPLESHGGPLFAQQRVGRGGKLFRMYKFRGMSGGEMPIGLSDLELAAYDAPRITRVGKITRKWGIDELPQLFHVLCGEMSLVGPRPLPPSKAPAKLYAPLYANIRPGITGLGVVRVLVKNNMSTKNVMRLDRLYAKRRSLCLDCCILARTPYALWKRGNF